MGNGGGCCGCLVALFWLFVFLMVVQWIMVGCAAT